MSAPSLPARQAPRRLTLFLALAAALYATALLGRSWLEGTRQAGLLAGALTLDLALSVPLAFAWLVARPRGWSPLAALPLFLLGLLTARAAFGATHGGTALVLERLALPLELGLLAWIVVRARRAARHARAQARLDPLERLHLAVRATVGAGRLAEVLAAELGLLYYACTPRLAAHVPPGARAFACVRRSGQAGLTAVLTLLFVGEGVALHLLLARWSPLAAWLLTASSGYALLWLVADLRALRARPLLVDGDELVVRAGLRWSARVPLRSVVRVTRKPASAERRNLAFLAQPTRWIELDAPLELHGPFGLRRHARALGLVPDEPEELERALTTHA